MSDDNKYSIAKSFSGLLHPLMMPLYLALVYLYIPPFAYSTVGLNKIIYLAIIILTFQVLPVLILFFLKRLGTISSVHLDNRQERFIPMIAIFLSFFMGLFILQKTAAPELLVILLKGVCLSILLVAAITIQWKISAHTTGVGGAMAIIFILSITSHANLSSWAMVLAIYSGILGWSRLYLNHHDKAQIYAGFLTGFCTTFAAFAWSI